MANWIPLPDEAKYRQMVSMGLTIADMERSQGLWLPNLRADTNLVLVSDYSGEEPRAKFHVLSYLLAGQHSLYQWDADRVAIRKRFLRNDRRSSFKGLGDPNKQKALGPFLAAASRINGLLFCVLIDKSIRWPASFDISKFSQLSWKQRVFEKLMRVLQYGNFVIAGLCREGQNLHWITDDDAIVANEQYQEDLCRLGGFMANHFGIPKMKEQVFGIAGKFKDGRRAEDLVSIADLVGGALSESLSTISASDIPRAAGLFIPFARNLSTKSQVTLAWLSSLIRPLAKLVCVIRYLKSGQLGFSFLSIQHILGITEEGHPLPWRPPDKGWRRAIESW